jgi:NADH-quinone oxidoreductase subunit J
MEWTFYIAAVVAVAATVMVVTGRNAVHAVLYLIVSLLALALAFYVLGAPFAAALEVIIYAGAIMVLFVFVIMLLNLGDQATLREQRWLRSSTWLGPAILSLLLLVEMLFVFNQPGSTTGNSEIANYVISAKAVGVSLYGPYLLAVEIASMLLLAGLVGAYHLGRGMGHGDASQSESKRNPQETD